MPWYRSKATKLEETCSNLNFLTAMDSYRSRKDEDGLTLAIAMVILHSAYDLEQSLLKNKELLKISKELKNYAKSTNPDVVIFEAAVFIHSAVGYSFSGSDLDLDHDEDGEISSAITRSIVVIAGLVEEKAAFPNAHEMLMKRGYFPDKQKSEERFIRQLIASKGREKPLSELGFRVGNLGSRVAVRVVMKGIASTQQLITVEEVTRIIKYHIDECGI